MLTLLSRRRSTLLSPTASVRETRGLRDKLLAVIAIIFPPQTAEARLEMSL
jgi:hypothetical protein